MYYEASSERIEQSASTMYYVLCNAALRTATVSRCRKLFSRPHEAIEAARRRQALKATYLNCSPVPLDSTTRSYNH